MPRIRTVKPELFLHEGLFDLERETSLPIRVAFIGLFCHVDREGRFKWCPRALGAQILPYDEVDFSRVLDALTTRGFVVRYACGGEQFGVLPTFTRHQVVNNRESASSLPDPAASDCAVDTSTRASRVEHACLTENQSCAGEGKGTRKGKEDASLREACSEVSRATPAEPPLLEFPTTGRPKKCWPLTQAKFDEYAGCYPDLDVMGEMRRALQWLRNNPRRKKTFVGMPAFLTRWLNKAVNDGRATSSTGTRNGLSEKTARSLQAAHAFASGGQEGFGND